MQASLEVIARSRGEGVLQSELPRLFEKQPTHYSYILKRLLALDLVVKSPIKLRQGGAQSTTLSTALLRHAHFATERYPAHEKVRRLSVCVARCSAMPHSSLTRMAYTKA